MNVDIYTLKGNSHAVNQDYVLATPTGISLCDGCGSAKDTDVGARLIARSKPDYDGERNLKDMVKWLSLPKETLYCTNLRLEVVEQEKHVRFERVGDGFVFYKLRDELIVREYRYAKNAPSYVGYSIFDEVDDFLSIEDNDLIIDGYTFDEKFNIKNQSTYRTKDISQLLESIELIPLEGLDFVGVSSDGMASFPYPPVEVFKEIFSFINFEGEFVQRRMKKAIMALNYTNHDDFSIGVIHFG